MSVEAEKTEAKSSVKDTVRVVIHALILALVVRVFLFQPFNIPSGSMIPTLLIGDYLFVSKYSYGYSRYSFPFGLDLFSGRVWAKEPRSRRRGRIQAAARQPDRLHQARDRLARRRNPDARTACSTSTARRCPRSAIDDYVVTEPSGRERHLPRFQETLPNGVSYPVLDLVQDGFGDNTEIYKVPEGHFFMMGDNRDNSTDSRYLSEVGFVPFENLVGKAQIIFFSMDENSSFLEFWHWPTSVRWPRIFQVVH